MSKECFSECPVYQECQSRISNLAETQSALLDTSGLSPATSVLFRSTREVAYDLATLRGIASGQMNISGNIFDEASHAAWTIEEEATSCEGQKERVSSFAAKVIGRTYVDLAFRLPIFRRPYLDAKPHQPSMTCGSRKARSALKNIAVPVGGVLR